MVHEQIIGHGSYKRRLLALGDILWRKVWIRFSQIRIMCTVTKISLAKHTISFARQFVYRIRTNKAWEYAQAAFRELLLTGLRQR